MSAEEAPLAPFPASDDWSYVDQAILAPMVRVGTLPMRLLAAEYGCTMAYSEETIDKKIMKCTRKVNEALGTIDFVVPSKGDRLAFRTVPGERVVFQIGTANGVNALKGASVVANDVRAIDVNMGCPKHFSIQGGMGVALLTDFERVRDVLTTLRRNLNVPITAKIRLLDKPQRTVELVKMIESCGVSAIGVHARQIQDRPRHQAMPHEVNILKESVNVPVLYNGDVFLHEDIERLKQTTKCDSVLIARGAMWNASIFRKEGMLPVYDVAKRYLEIAQQYNNRFANSKYCILEMIKGHVGSDKLYHKHMVQAKKYADLETGLENVREHPSISGAYSPPFKEWQPRPKQAVLSDLQRKVLARNQREKSVAVHPDAQAGETKGSAKRKAEEQPPGAKDGSSKKQQS